jgi:hypothetical protein
MRRLRLLVVALASACGSPHGFIGPHPEWGGTWNLRSINGKSLPAPAPGLSFLFRPGELIGSVTVLTSVLTLRGDGTYVESSSISLATGATEGHVELGWWEDFFALGIALSDRGVVDTSGSGMLVGDTLTITHGIPQNALTLRYTR